MSSNFVFVLDTDERPTIFAHGHQEQISPQSNLDKSGES